MDILILVTDKPPYGAGHIVRARRIADRLSSRNILCKIISRAPDEEDFASHDEILLVIDININDEDSRASLESVRRDRHKYKKIIYIDNLQDETVLLDLNPDILIIPYPVSQSYLDLQARFRCEVYYGVRECSFLYLDRPVSGICHLRRQRLRILFTTGATDKGKISLDFIKAIPVGWDYDIDVQLGIFYTRCLVGRIRRLAAMRGLKSVNISKWRKSPANFLENYNLVICSPGLTQYECIVRNIPFVLNMENPNLYLNEDFLGRVNRKKIKLKRLNLRLMEELVLHRKVRDPFSDKLKLATLSEDVFIC